MGSPIQGLFGLIPYFLAFGVLIWGYMVKDQLDGVEKRLEEIEDRLESVEKKAS